MATTTSTTFMDPQIWTGKIFNGDWITPTSGEYPVVEPATGAQLGVVGQANIEDVRQAADRAAEAQQAWAQAPFDQRARVLRRAGQSSEEPRLSMVRRLPVGVVGVISPFNAPVILSIRSVAPALALGNAVLLKPDPRTAVCGGVALARIFQEAGLPEGLLQLLPGGVDVGEAVVTNPHVRVISFTGSTAAGRAVGELAAKHLKRAHLELGGNNALIVLDDVDLEKAVSAGAFGSFMHQGQICMATGRHLVQERIADKYIERLAETAEHLTVGNPATQQSVALGPIIDARQRDKIHGFVTTTVDAGAHIVAGGR